MRKPRLKQNKADITWEELLRSASALCVCTHTHSYTHQMFKSTVYSVKPGQKDKKDLPKDFRVGVSLRGSIGKRDREAVYGEERQNDSVLCEPQGFH